MILMKITCMGSGYVGLVAGTCLSDLGNNVICADISEEKIETLKKGDIPIYEPGLLDMIKRNVAEGRLEFTTDISRSIKDSDVIFIGVGTPQGDDGNADLTAVFAVAKSIGENMNGYKVIVDKSTVPVGTGEKVAAIIKENQKEPMDFDVVSNPEFLREGAAIKDFQNPDRVVIGVESEKAQKLMYRIYKPLERVDKPIVFTNIKTAEMIKYASNSFLATKISFINELSGLCEKVGADVKMVAKGMGLDKRIGPRFLQAGIGYGGSCFPKDVQALMATANNNGMSLKILDAVESVNVEQKKVAISKAETLLGDLKGKKVALWGMAFKPRTDDMRAAPSLVIADILKKKGAIITAFDPVATVEAKKLVPEGVKFHDNPYDAVEGADLLIIVTEWDEFREPDFDRIKNTMNQPNIVDGRNIYDPLTMKELGFNYQGIGR